MRSLLYSEKLYNSTKVMVNDVLLGLVQLVNFQMAIQWPRLDHGSLDGAVRSHWDDEASLGLRNRHRFLPQDRPMYCRQNPYFGLYENR